MTFRSACLASCFVVCALAAPALAEDGCGVGCHATGSGSCVRDGWQHADWMADDRRDLLTTGMRAYTPSGVIGKPSEASAEKGKAALDSLTGNFARLLTLFERLNDDMA